MSAQEGDVFDQLLRRDEALALATSETDDFVRAFMKQALHTAHRIVIPQPGGPGVRPSSPVDMLFIAQLARTMANDRDVLKRFLDGNFLDDFGDPI